MRRELRHGLPSPQETAKRDRRIAEALRMGVDRAMVKERFGVSDVYISDLCRAFGLPVTNTATFRREADNATTRRIRRQKGMEA